MDPVKRCPEKELQYLPFSWPGLESVTLKELNPVNQKAAV